MFLIIQMLSQLLNSEALKKVRKTFNSSLSNVKIIEKLIYRDGTFLVIKYPITRNMW